MALSDNFFAGTCLDNLLDLLQLFLRNKALRELCKCTGRAVALPVGSSAP